MQINIITLFPEVFTAYLGASIPGRAAAAGKVSVPPRAVAGLHS